MREISGSLAAKFCACLLFGAGRVAYSRFSEHFLLKKKKNNKKTTTTKKQLKQPYEKVRVNQSKPSNGLNMATFPSCQCRAHAAQLFRFVVGSLAVAVVFTPRD